jgi:hypothetical protein
MKYTQCQSCLHLKDICSDLQLLKADLGICKDFKFGMRTKKDTKNPIPQKVLAVVNHRIHLMKATKIEPCKRLHQDINS